jgi:Tol biopolymer transport system component
LKIAGGAAASSSKNRRRLERGVESLARKGSRMVDLGDPAWRGMVCVETGNVADNEVRLAADGEHQMSTAISADAGAVTFSEMTRWSRQRLCPAPSCHC